MTTDKLIKIKPDEAGQRLDVFLASKLKITRSQAQKMIDGGMVAINGERPKKMGQPLKKNDVISIGQQSSNLPILQSSKPEKTERLKDYKISEPVIFAATPDYIVVEKPTGMLTHPTMANEKNTLVNFLTKKYPNIKKVGDDPKVRPGIVHRLDKEASGLLVVARTQKMFNHLKEQFKNRTVEKEYLALAHGRVAKDWDEITFPIARAERSDRMAARPLLASKNVGSRQYTDEENAPNEDISIPKEARTEFFSEKVFANCTLLRVILHTGRMHQIRVHLLAYNHPLVGDPLYFQKKRKDNLDKKCGRLFLHSAKLGFIDLKGEKQTFESPLPIELQKFLKLLK